MLHASVLWLCIIRVCGVVKAQECHEDWNKNWRVIGLNVSLIPLFGTIPAEIETFRLEVLDMANCNLTGDELSNWSSNKMSGPITNSISQCTSLMSLDLSSNMLVLVGEINHLEVLSLLNLSRNNITAHVPNNLLRTLPTNGQSPTWTIIAKSITTFVITLPLIKVH
ncbi:hypothetical protein AHAS_Ahas06G0128200 [Arachis hypogaea]